MVHLKEKPFYLTEEQIDWVEHTIASMTPEEKIGQLFVGMTGGTDEEEIAAYLEKSKIGGMRYMNLPADSVWEQNRLAQKHSKIPLLIACNVESGGNGACVGGTNVGAEIKVAAAGDVRYAYELGRICGIEGAAVGANWAFAPIVDLSRNWRNPIISTRTWGADAGMVLEMSKAYWNGLRESNMASAIKHFPGDGIDERDHHLSSSVNSLSAEEWSESFGTIYKGMIDAGVQSVMAGHIMLPSWQEKRNPDMKPEDMMPASLCKELITGLLKEELGFNGLVVTDASHMAGMTGRMARRDLVPMSIAAGCDMFLFFNDVEEDTRYMMEGLQRGILTEERLCDALRRILGLKASLGLWNKSGEEVMPPKEGIEVIGCRKHKEVAEEISQRGITMVKRAEDAPLPMSPEKYPRVLLVPLGKTNPLLSVMGMGGDKDPANRLKEELIKEGFQVSVYESPVGKLMEQIAAMSPEKQREAVSAALGGKGAYGGKESIAGFVSQYDVVITTANINSMGGTVQRISWTAMKGGWEIPYYVHEIPVIFVSFSSPFHLADVPQVQTYINCYDGEEHTVQALVQKLMGKSEFTGVSTVDAFCGFPDTRL